MLYPLLMVIAIVVLVAWQAHMCRKIAANRRNAS